MKSTRSTTPSMNNPYKRHCHFEKQQECEYHVTMQKCYNGAGCVSCRHVPRGALRVVVRFLLQLAVEGLQVLLDA